MIDKLKFEPVEGHVIIDFVNKKSKITPNIQIDIALKILEKLNPLDREKFFTPIYNAMIESQAEEYFRQKEASEKDTNSNTSPDVA